MNTTTARHRAVETAMMASLGNVSSCSFKETFIAEEADFLGII
jgi:hypothetical protein